MRTVDATPSFCFGAPKFPVLTFWFVDLGQFLAFRCTAAFPVLVGPFPTSHFATLYPSQGETTGFSSFLSTSSALVSSGAAAVWPLPALLVYRDLQWTETQIDWANSHACSKFKPFSSTFRFTVSLWESPPLFLIQTCPSSPKLNYLARATEILVLTS